MDFIEGQRQGKADDGNDEDDAPPADEGPDDIGKTSTSDEEDELFEGERTEYLVFDSGELWNLEAHRYYSVGSRYGSRTYCFSSRGIVVGFESFCSMILLSLCDGSGISAATLSGGGTT